MTVVATEFEFPVFLAGCAAVGIVIGLLAGLSRRPLARLMWLQLGVVVSIAGAFIYLVPGLVVLAFLVLAGSLALWLRRWHR